MDFQSLLYDPIYDAIGVSASLTSSAGTTASITVLDRTSGVAVADRTLIETIKPACVVRAVELAANSIARADLSNGNITFNGATWRIKGTQARPSPNGEADGEYLLFLLNEG
jgi:hypothetical protein